jgi:phosphotransferase system IIB component
LNIITFGILYFYAKHKAKQQLTTTNSDLTYSTKINFNIDELVDNLGGLDNVIDCNATISSLKITIKNINAINKDNITKLGAKGIMINNNQVIILFGDNAMTIDKMLKQKL